jgi:protein TonB
MPSRRLTFASLLSLLLHLAVLAGGDLLTRRPAAPARPTPAMLEAMLVPVPAAAERLLKNTLTEDRPAAQQPLPPPERPAVAGRRSPAADAQRKLASHLYYPEEAIARGLEGETRLLLSLEADGRIDDAQVASSSGHAILDQAAVRAAWAMGRLDAGGQRQLILPVVFRLRP